MFSYCKLWFTFCKPLLTFFGPFSEKVNDSVLQTFGIVFAYAIRVETQHRKGNKMTDRERAKAYKKIVKSLSRQAKKLLTITAGNKTVCLTRVGPNTLQYRRNWVGGYRDSHFTNNEVKELSRAGLITLKRLGDNVGQVDTTELGQFVNVHNY